MTIKKRLQRTLVLSTILGYEIPFTSLTPLKPEMSEPKLFLSIAKHYNIEINLFLEKGAIKYRVPSPDQFLSNFFVIKKSWGGMRFIFNLKDLNFYIEPPHFKLEDLRTFVQLMLPNMYMSTLNIEDVLLVSIHETHRKYLQF